MPILKDAAQVLRTFEQGNTSLVVVLLGRQLGQFRVHAKGIRRWSKKGFEGGLDLLTRGEIVVYPRKNESLWIVKEWDERVRPAVGQSLPMLQAASFLCEFTETLTRPTAGSLGSEAEAAGADGSRARLHDALAGTADALAQGQPAGLVVLGYTLAALSVEGVLPSFENCGQCGQAFPERARVRLLETGLHCETCFKELAAGVAPAVPRGVWLSPEALQALRHIAKTQKPVRLSAHAAESLAKALILLVHGALEQDLRTLLPVARLMRGVNSR